MLPSPAGFRSTFSESAPYFLLPSVRDIVFLFLLWSLLAGTLSNRPLADPDIGWHIRTGERILATHTLPPTDPYSSTMQGERWFAWEWLYDLLLGILYRAGGLNGVAWLCAVVVATVFALVLSQLHKRGTGLLLSILLMLLAEAAAIIHLFARPHIVSWLFTLLWFIALEKWEQCGSGNSRERLPQWLPWFFPASIVLWVNLHGAWVFGLALLAIYALSAFGESLRTHDAFAAIRASHRARAMALAAIFSAPATLLNPYGWNLHIHIYRYLTDRYLMNHIAEFHSPDFHGWAQRCFAVILLLTLFAFASSRGRISLSHLLVALLAVYAGLLSNRNLPVSAILLVLIVGPILSQQFAALATQPGAWGWLRRVAARIADFSDRMGAQESSLRGHLWPIAASVAALAICVQGGWLGSHHLIEAQFDPEKIPVAAVAYLEKQPGTDPIFSIDSWGGYLIYRLYPQRKVVMDDRHDLYGSDRVRQALVLLQGEPGWREILEKWHIHTLLLPAESTLANLLPELPQEWQLTYTDNVAVVFEKRSKPAD